MEDHLYFLVKRKENLQIGKLNQLNRKRQSKELLINQLE
jgi:hypothetical protein